MSNIVPADSKPSFLQTQTREEVDESMAMLDRFIRPPRAKICQPQRTGVYKNFDEGDVVLTPANILLAPVRKAEKNRGQNTGEVFHLTPLFFFPEWCLWNPIELKGSQPAIVERTTDPEHPMVARCQNEKLWYEECPGSDKPRRYVEHLNYICAVHQEELEGIPVLFSFFRGEHRTGTGFNMLLRMRKAKMFGGVYQAQANFRSSGKGEWYGLDISNPESEDISPWVTEEQYARYTELNEQYAKAHADGLIQTDYEDNDGTGEGEPADPAKTAEF